MDERIRHDQTVARWRHYIATDPHYWRQRDANLFDPAHDQAGELMLWTDPTGRLLKDSSAFLSALGAAYRESGRSRPLVDGFGHNPYPKTSAESPDALHPAGFVGEGDYRELVAALRAAFAGTGQRSLDVWYLEDGYQSRVPAALARRYGGRETVPTVPAAVQAAHLRRAILLAACQPHVRAFFNFELVDEKRLTGWQSGLVWRGARAKPAARAFADAARAIGSGGLRCRQRP